jgi:hypothetical protein
MFPSLLYNLLMCAGQSYQQPTDESSVTVNTVRSVYRVLRGSSRGELRSVNRNPSGRNATSVKVLSPVKRLSPWWPSNYVAAKAAPAVLAHPVQGTGTTGVRGHGMLERLLMEPRRSLESRSRLSKRFRQDVMFKLGQILSREVRCFHSSKEVR